MKLKLAVVLAVLGLSLSAFAQEETRQVDRKVRTDNRVIMSVASCSVPTATWDDFDKAYHVTAKLIYSYCQEFRSYKANVVGKGWNAKESAVPGTDSLSYGMETDEKTVTVKAENDTMAQVLAVASATSQCLQQKQLLEELQRARQGQSQCR